MGVNSLWDIVGQTARPVRLESLSRKKVAVDASIWIYQFLKAVRDKEGNSLPQSHIVGFFRRICKLLYFGIYPIFVFDGSAPALKRRTVQERRERRQGNRENTSETAQRLLATQIRKQTESLRKKDMNDQEDDPEKNSEITYFEDLPNVKLHEETNELNSPEVSATSFRKADEYHLPKIAKFTVSKGDSRIMPKNAYDDYFDEFEYVDGISIDSVDPSSKEFSQLPLSTQYTMLSHLRLRSRLRMGYSKEQLEALFPESIDFSRFQIQQVQKRNFFTQKLMDVSGMGNNDSISRRIAGDKDKNYVLARNENGWSLSLGESEPYDESSISVKNKVPSIVSKEDSEWKTQNIDTHSDEDVEFDDVSLSDHSDVDDKVNMAIIESIYSQYTPEVIGKQSIDNAEKHKETSKRRDEDLKRAIELSKNEYYTLRNREELTKAENLHWNISDNRSELLQTEAYVDDDLSSVNLGNSFLFPGNHRENTHKSSKVDIKGGKRDIMVPFDMAQEGMSKKSDNQDQFGSEIREKEQNDEGDPAPKPMPSWFKEDLSSNNYSDLFMEFRNDISGSRYHEDHEAGLLSWNEVKNTMDAGSRQDEMDNIEDVQEIVSNNVTGNLDLVGEDKTGKKTEECEQEQNKINESASRKPIILDYDFEEDDERTLERQLNEEEADHEHFKSSIKNSNSYKDSLSSIYTTITNDQLLQEKLQKTKRDSDEVTETMINDVQELLRRFGVPYITAPMEAEAQCSELSRLGLVDGIVTDDSDCFLFGGNNVYKNMFNQKQYVEFYTLSDIEAKLGLNQDRLIELALLLGSDYTKGIKGIGPVLAVEILAEFGSLKNLKEWFDQNTKFSTKQDEPSEPSLSPLRRNLLKRISNGTFFLSDSFPDQVVVDAYKKPEVDHDESEFKWGSPSLDKIRSFLMYNLNWTQAKVDEIMIPLIRDMNSRKTQGIQSTIGEFFPREYIQSSKELRIGKRLKSATSKLNKKRHMSVSR